MDVPLSLEQLYRKPCSPRPQPRRELEGNAEKARRAKKEKTWGRSGSGRLGRSPWRHTRSRTSPDGRVRQASLQKDSEGASAQATLQAPPSTLQRHFHPCVRGTPPPHALLSQFGRVASCHQGLGTRMLTAPQGPGHQKAHTQIHHLHSFHKHRQPPISGSPERSNQQKGLLSALHTATSMADPGPQAPRGTRAGVSE